MATKAGKRMVPAEVAQVMLLDKLLGKVATLEEKSRETALATQQTQTLLRSMIAEGIIEPLKEITVTTEPTVATPPYKDVGKLWFGVKLTNDGPDSVWFIVNPRKSSMTAQELKLDETWGVDFKTAVIEEILLYTESGTGTVRVRGMR